MNSSNVHDTIDRSISKTIAKLKLNTESTGYGAEDRIVPFNGLKESSDIRKNLLGQYEIMLDQESSDHLVGDFSMSHCLPFITTGAKHEDLKSIKPSTVSCTAWIVFFYLSYNWNGITNIKHNKHNHYGNNNNNNSEFNASFVFIWKHRGRPFHAIMLFCRNEAMWDMHGREKSIVST